MPRLLRPFVSVAILTQILITCGRETLVPRLATRDELLAIQNDPASNGAPGTIDMIMHHMLMSPTRPVENGDSARATKLADDIRKSIAKFSDTTAAVSAGYEHFVNSDVEVHFNSYSTPPYGTLDPAKPSSILYLKTKDGLKLSGAMYNIIGSANALDSVTPLSLIRWHKHVNWCQPGLDEQRRWNEKREGRYLFGNFGTASQKVCANVRGVFFPDLAGWMVHANVVSGRTLEEIWGGTQMGSHLH